MTNTTTHPRWLPWPCIFFSIHGQNHKSDMNMMSKMIVMICFARYAATFVLY
jgi:hypothetical protein